MFDSLKSKLKTIFKKAPAEIAEPGPQAVQEPAKPETVTEEPKPQLSRKEQRKLGFSSTS